MSPARPMLAPCVSCRHPGNDHELLSNAETQRMIEEQAGGRGACGVLGCACTSYRRPTSISTPASGIPPDLGEDLV